MKNILDLEKPICEPNKEDLLESPQNLKKLTKAVKVPGNWGTECKSSFLKMKAAYRARLTIYRLTVTLTALRRSEFNNMTELLDFHW